MGARLSRPSATSDELTHAAAYAIQRALRKHQNLRRVSAATKIASVGRGAIVRLACRRMVQDLAWESFENANDTAGDAIEAMSGQEPERGDDGVTQTSVECASPRARFAAKQTCSSWLLPLTWLLGFISLASIELKQSIETVPSNRSLDTVKRWNCSKHTLPFCTSLPLPTTRVSNSTPYWAATALIYSSQARQTTVQAVKPGLEDKVSIPSPSPIAKLIHDWRESVRKGGYHIGAIAVIASKELLAWFRTLLLRGAQLPQRAGEWMREQVKTGSERSREWHKAAREALKYSDIYFA